MIIGIGGSKFTGKDTSAKYFVSKGYTALSFAGPLKDVLSKSLDIPRNFFDDQSLKEQEFKYPFSLGPFDIYFIVGLLEQKFGGISEAQFNSIMQRGNGKELNTPRAIMQFVGTNLFRECVSEHYWTDAMRKQLAGIKDAVICDVRFPQERELVARLGGQLLRIKRDGYDSKDGHASETSLGEDTDYDAIVHNNSTVDALYNQLGDWYDSIGSNGQRSTTGSYSEAEGREQKSS